LCRWAKVRAHPRLVAAANTHLVTMARRNSRFLTAMRRFDLIVPDGMPLVWYLNLFKNGKLSDRVYGPTLMLRCLEASPAPFKHFFLGGSNETREMLEKKVQILFPSLLIAEGYSPPFGIWDGPEETRILESIAASNADFVWVGLGCPKQEQLLGRLRND